MFVIGLTGGIGTGKTEVAKKLEALGAEVVDADRVGHEVYARGTDGWEEVVAQFGEGVLSPSGEIDRGKLGAIVFADQPALERLNKIVHPRIRSIVQERLRELERQGTDAAVVEAAVLQEARWHSLVDEVWVTTSPREQVLERVARRSGLRPDEVEARIDAQMSQGERVDTADAVIDNSGSLEDLRERVRQLWTERVPRPGNRK